MAAQKVALCQCPRVFSSARRGQDGPNFCALAPLFFANWAICYSKPPNTSTAAPGATRGVLDVAEELPRTVTATAGTAIAVGLMIGSGIFASPAEMLASTHSCGVSLAMWLTAGIIAMLGGLCVCELGAIFPTSGGAYVYFLKLGSWVGPALAFSYVWSMFWVIKSGSLAIIATVFARYFSIPILRLWALASGDQYEQPLAADVDAAWSTKALAVAALAGVSILNCFQVKWAVMFQKLSVLAKCLALLLIVMLALVYGIFEKGGGVLADNLVGRELDGKGVASWSVWDAFTIVAAIMPALWAYDGYADLNMMTEEIKRPVQRNLLIAVVGGTGGVALAYMAINAAFMSVLPFQELTGQQFAVNVVAQAGLGKVAADIVIPLCIAVTTLGSLNASAMTGGRLFFAAAREGQFPFPSYVSRLSRWDTPYVAICLQAAWASIVILPGGFSSLVSYTGICSYIFYALTIVALMVFRSKYPEESREPRQGEGVACEGDVDLQRLNPPASEETGEGVIAGEVSLREAFLPDDSPLRRRPSDEFTPVMLEDDAGQAFAGDGGAAVVAIGGEGAGLHASADVEGGEGMMPSGGTISRGDDNEGEADRGWRWRKGGDKIIWHVERVHAIRRPFAVRPYPLIPLLYIGASALVVLALLVERVLPSLAALAFVGLSVPVYFLFFWRENYPQRWLGSTWRRFRASSSAAGGS